jgi:hypothetical protein
VGDGAPDPHTRDGRRKADLHPPDALHQNLLLLL